MTPLRKTAMQEKLLRLQESVKILERIRVEEKEKFLQDSILQGACMYHLLISIEILVDIGSHILSEVFQIPAKTYRQVVELLGEQGVIPREFSAAHSAMADFRNKLIHDYQHVSEEKVFLYLQKAPDVFREFAKYYSAFFDKQ